MSAHRDTIRRLRTALPRVREWIEQLLQCHSSHARAVSTCGLPGLAKCFPRDLLESAKVVSVDRVLFPPVSRFGLQEFAPLEQARFEGITFIDTVFVLRGRESESLYFHELVHVVQWARLGIDNFLFAYGAGLATFGYENSPLEQMAYALQRAFDSGNLPPNVFGMIEQATDTVWQRTAPLLYG